MNYWISALLLFSAPAWAFQIKRDQLYFDASGAFSSAGSSAPSGSSGPTLLGLGVGGSAGYQVKGPVFLSLAADVDWVGQYTAPDSVVGNRKGTRFSIAPQVGAKLGDFIVKADVQLMGNYKLSLPDIGGNTVTYTKPFGFRLQGLYALADDFYGGLSFETVSFSNQHLDGPNAGDSALSQNFSLTQFGVTLAYTF